MWRNDGTCGSGYPLRNGKATQCDPDGENPCCSDIWDGECGNTTEHCSCWGCTDYKFAKWWRESGGTQMWRNDGKCGYHYPLPNGTVAQCDPDGKNPCCSSDENGECGNMTEHCSCRQCTNYTLLYNSWRESGGTQMWRYDGKCGEYYPLPNGKAAQCDPDGVNPCCSNRWDEECGNTTKHCSCSSCTDYKFAKWWRESGGTQMWRNDGKCGSYYPLPNGTAAQCDPNGENPCCSNRWDGECGNTTKQCSCWGCTDYKFSKWWRKSGGTQMWRNDGKCGSYYPLPNGTAAQCDPDGENPCCSNRWDGECGNTTKHCSCRYCTDYKFAKWWRESGGTQMWRNDGKCGRGYRLPNGTAAQCDPDGKNPCCSDFRSGECGSTAQQCYCMHCTNYTRIYKEWRESRGTQMWRYDGLCGSYYPLPDGTAAQCNPDGENPCCIDVYDGELECGNTSEHCSCLGCTYYKFAKWWRESGGTQMWRNDGKCGSYYPLPNGTAAQCDPDGKNPCCSSTSEYGECGNTAEHCFCNDCVNYNLEKYFQKLNNNCTFVRLPSGFLKFGCYNETTKRMKFQCANSDVFYEFEYSDIISVSDVCKNDPYVYQACGFSNDITGTEVLCGGYFCQNSDTGSRNNGFIKCQGDNCIEENRDCSSKKDESLLCNDKCEEDFCKDESDCNGYKYGVECEWKYGNYLPPDEVCFYPPESSKSLCYDALDKLHCGDLYNTTTCTHYLRHDYNYYEDLAVPILNYTRCSVFELSIWYTYPYCLDYLDQTNCSDKERVGGYCEVNGFLVSVSKYVLCYEYDPITNLPVKICDDDMQNNCLYPSTSECQVHKHLMCDGVKDCPDGTDEFHDMCETMTDKSGFTCKRRFNPKKPDMDIPLSWIGDNETDCMHCEDEDLNQWQLCPGEFRQVLMAGEECKDAYKCPDNNEESFVPFYQLCDGVESCGDGGESEVCRIARDFPYINKDVSYESNSTVQNVCIDSSDCEQREFKKNSEIIFGVTLNTQFLMPASKTSCNDLFGEHYLFLSCMDLCLEPEATCPLDKVNSKLEYNSCPGQFLNRTYTIVDNAYLTFVMDSDNGGYHQEFYQCKNSRCVEYKQVCDLVDDCGDMSDEINCTNHMICEDTRNSSKHQFIALSQKCDGIYDCFDLSDECNDGCGKEILGNWFIKTTCWFTGLLALFFNFFSAANGFISLRNCETENMLTSKALMSLIGSGDFLIGLYLVVLSVFDSFIHGKDFCRHQAEWLTGTACLTLGVISTLGSQISLFTMTVLSVIRMYGLTCKAMRVPGPVTKKSILRVASVVMITITAALAIAITPLVPSLEDYFVQGVYYDPDYKIFVGFPNKERHVKVLQAYYDQNKTGNATNFSTKMSWKEIGEKVDGMFTQDQGHLSRKPVHFYGNDGVCLFKYFVRTDDARKSRQSLDIQADIKDPVVWTMLAVNLFCFIVITCCYIVITWKTKQSSQRSGQHDNEERQKNERAIQNKIMIIIATDFLCWVPFIAISALHNLAYIDASKWYATFAMTVLPLNSVINPLVYDKALADFVARNFDRVKDFAKLFASSAVSKIIGLFGAYDNDQEQSPEEIEIGQINVVQNRNVVHNRNVVDDIEDNDENEVSGVVQNKNVVDDTEDNGENEISDEYDNFNEIEI